MATMTVAEVRKRVEQVRAAARIGDYEAAHNREDELWYDVLKAIALCQVDDPVAVANAALRTKGIDFQRVCA